MKNIILSLMAQTLQNRKKNIRPLTTRYFPSTRHRFLIGFSLLFFTFTFLFAVVLSPTKFLKLLIPVSERDVSQAAEVATLPQPRALRAFGDDRVATIEWEPIRSDGIVGYYVKWGKKSTGTFTDSKQTIYPITQIQPLQNGVEYAVQIQAVQGTYVHKPTQSEQGGSDTFAQANGNLSLPATISVTPTNSRVAGMKQRLTGFFDDFTLPMGAFDETKWNHAVNACVSVGEDGQFINAQFHAHNMTQSGFCDRGGSVSRARGVFDITGKTEADPGVIEFDLDGVSQPRDVWYIDIIPTDARKNGIPLDITSHNDLFDADSLDPGRMIRIAQLQNGTATINFHYYGANNAPGSFGSANLNVNMSQKTPGYEFMSQVDYPVQSVVPNVRRHWRIEYSTRLKLFIDGVKLADAPVPPLFSNIKKYQIHSTLFSYNTGKQFDTVAPSTSMLHWDNFGFNGPAATIVTHNYIDGGATGTTPLLARGTKAFPVPSGNRTTKIPLPDPLGTPIGQARLMYTVQPFGYSYYYWNATNAITINGKKYPVPDPTSLMNSPVGRDSLSMTNIPFASGIYVNPADLVQGVNTVSFNFNADVLNVHLEIDYPKNSAPAYTQPRDLFPNLMTALMPVMRPNDEYWFIEQKMGVPSLSPVPISTPATNDLFSVQPPAGYTFTPDTLATGKQMYSDERRFTFFGMPDYLKDSSYVRTDNLGIKDKTSLQWSITLKKAAEVYIIYRKIPGAGVPTWISSRFSALTNDDLSQLNQYLLRKNELGLIGLYDIYKTTPNFNGNPVQVQFGPASDATHTAYSMYMVGVKGL